MIYLHNGILHSRKKEVAPTVHDNLDGTGMYYASEVSQAVKDKYYMISRISGT